LKTKIQNIYFKYCCN